MKRWGKSPPLQAQARRHGKPHRVQGQIGDLGAARSGSAKAERVPGIGCLDKWFSPPHQRCRQNSAYSPSKITSVLAIPALPGDCSGAAKRLIPSITWSRERVPRSKRRTDQGNAATTSFHPPTTDGFPSRPIRRNSDRRIRSRPGRRACPNSAHPTVPRLWKSESFPNHT